MSVNGTRSMCDRLSRAISINEPPLRAHQLMLLHSLSLVHMYTRVAAGTTAGHGRITTRLLLSD